MRLSVLSILLLLTGGVASAEGTAKPSPLQSDDLWVRQQACKGVGSVAETIMTERQKEVPMSELIDRLKAAEGMGLYEGTGIDTNLLVKIITAAYKQSAYSSPEYQADMVAAFRNEIELPCFEGTLVPKP